MKHLAKYFCLVTLTVPVLLVSCTSANAPLQINVGKVLNYNINEPAVTVQYTVVTTVGTKPGKTYRFVITADNAPTSGRINALNSASVAPFATQPTPGTPWRTTPNTIVITGPLAADILRLKEQKDAEKEFQNLQKEGEKALYDWMTGRSSAPSFDTLQRNTQREQNIQARISSIKAERQLLINSPLPSAFAKRIGLAVEELD